MLRLLLSLTPANLLHELGTGRALDNARREREELARTMADRRRARPARPGRRRGASRRGRTPREPPTRRGLIGGVR